MGTEAPDSGRTMISKDNKDQTAPPSKLDAGDLFVLKSRGSWLHCGYHLTTSIVAPALLSIPFAIGLLGWGAGMVCLSLAALVTFYSYNLLSLVLEDQDRRGKRQLHFRAMANDILGPGWGKYFVGPLQLGICYGAVISCILIGGQSLKFIYLVARPNGSMQLSHFIVIFGGLKLIMAQMPSFHSLRHINLVSLLLCLAYCACTTAGSIYIGKSRNAPPKNYDVTEVGINRLFGTFNAISIIATTYGNGIIPEIQATMAAPIQGKMFKGLLVCYSVIISTFFSVGISGYWAFGNQVMATVLSNFTDQGKNLVPEWFLLITNIFVVVQVSAVSLTYLQPTNVVIERRFADPEKEEFSARNIIPRIVFRSLSIVIATTIAAMLPFFGDIMALLGALGFIPLDMIMPAVFYNVTFKPSKRSLMFWGNAIIAVVATVLAVVGSVASVRQIIIDAKNYRLFANV
ncbi:GABA transporter 1-like [Apium graveolens]|uniref:GABA transporter 1-like n=1 Tax=Apium graveolens TaxID=4045 RepID=UPI003D7A1DF9